MSRPPRDPHAPPRLALRLLERALRGPEGEALLGDLLESWHERRPRLGRARAARWFWRDAAAALLAAPALRRRAGRAPAIGGGDGPLRGLAGDLRHGARLLRRAPLFTAVSVLTLALGIGATTAIFAVVNPILLRPLPFPAPERLAMLWEVADDGSATNTGYATVADLAREARTVERLAAAGTLEATIAEGGEPERLAGQRVTWGYFRTLGVAPALGRDFTAEEDAPGREHVVLLSHGLWRRRFGGDSAVVGRTVRLDDVAHTVVGVMPAGFVDVLAPDAQLWRALGYERSLPWACRSCRHLRLVVRARPGVATAAAAGELQGIMDGLARRHPVDYGEGRIRLVPLQAQVSEAARPVLLVLLGAVLLVLLMAAANVATLQLARAIRREGEFAVRAALGAGRGRLARQLLAEGALLAAGGAAVGLAVAHLALPALVAQLPGLLPRAGEVRLDGAALLVGAGLAAALGVVVGLVPAWRGRRTPSLAALRDGARLAGGGRRAARAGLVTLEVALALMLLAGAGLLGRSLTGLLAVDPGFRLERRLTLQLFAAGERYREPAAVWAHHDRLRDAVRALPGVADVAHATQLPLSGSTDTYGVRAQDGPAVDPSLTPHTDRYVVSPGFLRVMGIPLLRGRPLTDADNDAAAAPVIVLSASVARGLFPGQDALGRRVQVGGRDTPWREVVGIAGDVRHRGFDATVAQQVYVPERQWPWADDAVTLVVRTHGDPAALGPLVRRTVQALDPAQPVSAAVPLHEVAAASVAPRRLALVLFVAFAATAVVMAAAGLYGVLAGSVAERARELGVRSALGASPRALVALVLSQAARLVVAGVALGLLGALALARFLGALLYGVRPGDPATLAATAALLAAVALAACVPPLRRALRVDPMTALRQ